MIFAVYDMLILNSVNPMTVLQKNTIMIYPSHNGVKKLKKRCAFFSNTVVILEKIKLIERNSYNAPCMTFF